MKKFLNALLAFVLVFAMAAPAMAADDLADVKGTKYEAAVNELAALEILNGYPDGTFKADNTITRAEFAKVIVLATNNKTMVKYLSNSPTKFSDVKVGDWFNGYVAAATAKGFLKGYPDGTFKPNAEISYQEVLTVLVRALGYEDEKLAGNWPYNFLIQADELGLISDVDVNASASASRGDVAILTSNTLDTETVTWDSDGGKYTPGDKLIVELGGTDPKIVKESSLTADNEVVFADGKVKVADKFMITGGLTLSDLVGHEVTVVTNSDGKVVVITDAQSEDKVVTGSLNADLTVNKDTYGEDLIDLVDVDDKYDIAKGAIFLVNSEVVGSTDQTISKDVDVTLFLDNQGEVRFLVTELYATGYNGVSFKDYTKSTSYRKAKLYFNNNVGSVEVKEDAEITLNGKAASLSDLEENDVIYLVKNQSGYAVKVEAVRNIVEGKVTAIIDNDIFEVDGKEYAKSDNYFKETGKTIGLEAKVKFYLNKDNHIVYVDVLDEGNTSTVVGYVAKVKPIHVLDENLGDTQKHKVTLFTNDGETVTYNMDTGLQADTFVKHYVNVVFNEDGVATAIADRVDVSVGGANVTDVDDDLVTAGTGYKVNDNTIVINVETDGEPKLAKLSDVTVGDSVVFYSEDGITADVVFLITDADAEDDQDLSAVDGLFVKAKKVETVSGTVYTAQLKTVDGEKTFDITGAIYANNYNKNDLVTLSENNGSDGDALYDVATKATAATSIGDIKTDGTFTIDSNKYIATDETVVFVIDVDGNVSVGDYADVLDLDGATIGTDANVYVTDSGSDIGVYNVARTIVIKKN